MLYLKWDSWGRELKNEDKLINKLSKFDNYKFINGKETLVDMIRYLTNVVFVIYVILILKIWYIIKKIQYL